MFDSDPSTPKLGLDGRKVMTKQSFTSRSRDSPVDFKIYSRDLAMHSISGVKTKRNVSDNVVMRKEI